MNQDDLIPTQSLIPIGKHKGKPLEVLLNDRETLQWWRDHPSVAKKYPFVIQFINNFDEPTPTPLHNLFQIEFLDETIRRKTYSLFAQERLLRRTPMEQLEDANADAGSLLVNRWVEVGKPRFEQGGGVDVEYHGEFYLQFRSAANRNGFRKSEKATDELSQTYPYFISFHLDSKLRAELKPLLGDDYPAILRKMSAKKRNCLIYDKYDGCISLKDLNAFFATENIVVIQKADIENVSLPMQRRQIAFEG
jgi:hypothetical protein